MALPVTVGIVVIAVVSQAQQRSVVAAVVELGAAAAVAVLLAAGGRWVVGRGGAMRGSDGFGGRCSWRGSDGGIFASGGSGDWLW